MKPGFAGSAGMRGGLAGGDSTVDDIAPLCSPTTAATGSPTKVLATAASGISIVVIESAVCAGSGVASIAAAAVTFAPIASIEAIGAAS